MKTKTLLTIIAIIASVGSALLGVYFGEWLTISFDKQGAAQQFYIEISSMNDSLQSYALPYSQNKDIMCNGSDVNIDKNTLTALNFEDTNRPYKLVFSNKTITTYKGSPDPHYNNWETEYVGFFPFATTPLAKIELFSCYPTYLIMPSPLYNEHGMYFIYVKDIPKFDSKLANDLDTFYNDITSAEADRSYVQNYLDQNGGKSITTWQTLRGQYFSAYMDMRMHIINASELEPTILEELKQQSGIIKNQESDFLNQSPDFKLSSSMDCRLKPWECWPFAPISHG
jgi:hypothetical protein